MMKHVRIAAATAALFAATPAAFAQMAMEPETITVGDIAITQPWARATPPAAVTGAGYLTITNNGATDDRLLAFDTAQANIAEVHEMSMANDRMVMRPLEDGLPIPAGETVVLQPGGYHLMMIELTDAIVEGTPVTVTLTFEVAGAVTFDLMVYPIGSSGPAGQGGMDMGGMTMDGMNMEGMAGGGGQ